MHAYYILKSKAPICTHKLSNYRIGAHQTSALSLERREMVIFHSFPCLAKCTYVHIYNVYACKSLARAMVHPKYRF